MTPLLRITKALADENRLRALLFLQDGERCLCEIVPALGLAPATVSRHMSILYEAGLVHRQAAGRWHYFQLAQDAEDPVVRDCLNWVMQAMRPGESPSASAETFVALPLR